jgi:hypothetical protein
MKNLIKASLIIVLFISAITSEVKAQFVSDINGRPYRLKEYTDIEGSPYLYDDWASGTVKIANAQVFSNLYLKYNELEGKLYFKGKTGEVLEFVDQVVEFTISNKIITRHFSSYPGNKPNEIAYYELLADGNTKLFKQPVKEIQEIKVYGSAVSSKNFIAVDKYYLLTGGKMIPIKKDKKSVIAGIGKKQPELEAYIKTNSLNLKDDADLAKLIEYSNSL